MIDRGGSQKNSREERARKAREQYMNGGVTRDSNIINSIKELFKPKTQQAEKPAGSSYALTPQDRQKFHQYAEQARVIKANKVPDITDVTRKRLSQTNPVQSGGQFQTVKTAVDMWRESVRPKSIADYASVAARVHTTKDQDVYNFYGRYVGQKVNQDFHDRAITAGNKWMFDQKGYADYITSAATPEERAARHKECEEYFKQALNEVPTYDPTTHTYATQNQFKKDAPLPPWVAHTVYNSYLWEYYTAYSHDVVQQTADAYREARDKGREYARNPYKSAFERSESEDQIDSFLDIAISSIDLEGGFDATYENLLYNTIDYFRDYVINPIKAGNLKTAAGNALWNLMDTMDVASRGVRALIASDTVLGGSAGREFKSLNSGFDDYYANTWAKYGLTPSSEYERNKYHGTWERNNDAKFKGQNVYWAQIPGHSEEEIMRAQQLFMDNGGYDLLLARHPEYASKADLGRLGKLSSSERAGIAKELDRVFTGSSINWRDIYKDINDNFFTEDRAIRDVKQGIQNVKKAYTDVDANFNADTGNLAADIILETVSDPGMVAGALSRNLVKRGVSSAAENAVRKGLLNIAKDSDEVEALMKNKKFRAAIASLINNNEGKNIIFKHIDDFDTDVKLFLNNIADQTDLFANPEARKTFKEIVTGELMGKNYSINGAIISAQKFARHELDSKVFKAAYFMDKSIDAIDSAIVKSSFFLPWAGVKGIKSGFRAAMSTEAMTYVMKKLDMRRFASVRKVISERTGDIDVTKFSELAEQADRGLHREADVRTALKHVVDKYDEIAWNTNDLIRKFSRGEITEDEAYKALGDMIYERTGGKYRYVSELGGYVDTIAPRYAGDIKSAFGRIDDTFRRLQDTIERQSDGFVDRFIDEVRQAEDVSELRRLFGKHLDNPRIMALSDRVIDNVQFKVAGKELTTQALEVLKQDVRRGIIQSDIKKGVKAASEVSEKTIERTISFDQMDTMLKNMGVDWERTLLIQDVPGANIPVFDSKIADFMSAWQLEKSVTYNVEDALRFVDRLERQVQFREIMRADTISEMSALQAHDMIGQFNALRRQLKKTDLINLKDVKVVLLPQMDRMAMNLEFRSNKDIQELYGSFYDDVIAPIVDTFKGMSSDEVELMDSSLFADIDELAKQKYGFDRTSQLIEEAKVLPGFSDDQLHSFLNTLATDFRFHDELGNIDLSPGALRRKMEATLRAQTGQSKVGMKNITDSLQSLYSDNPSGFLAKYADELKENPELLKRYSHYVDTDVLDPRAYVEKQMLFTVLADPSVIPEWNALAAKGQSPIMMHINTTGLNTELNSMSSVAFRKWFPIDVSKNNPLTLERLLDAMDTGETTVFQRHMTDDELGEFTEQVIRQLDMKDCNPDNIMKRYKEVYGISDSKAYKSEDDMIEEVCDFINGNTIVKEGDGGLRSVAPCLVVHDLDGFNIDYFNNKVNVRANTLDESSKTYDYLNRVSGSARANSYNTYYRLASMSGDISYTDEQLDLITNMLHDYIDDINHFANGYRFNDVQSYSRKLHDIFDGLLLKEEANRLNTYEEQFLDLFRQANGRWALSAYDVAVKNITDLGLYPRQFAFTATGLEDNITKAALKATGRDTINVGTRVYVDDVLSYFNLETEDGFYTTIEDLRKMHEVSQYIIRTRNTQIVAGAEEFLLPHKADFDRIIQSMIDIAQTNSYSATKLSYLQNMRIPDNAIDSFLMARKLYSDHLKYWLDVDELSSLRTGGKDLDAMKERLASKARALGLKSPAYKLEKDNVFKAACDYVNDNRVRFFDELTGGGFDVLDLRLSGLDESSEIMDALRAEIYDSSDELLDILQGAHEPEIFNWAVRSDFEKRVLNYKNGVMKSGLDKATHYREACSEITSNMRQLRYIDDYFTAAGITRRQDRFTASIYSKSKELFDMLDDTGLLKRDSFYDFLQKASRMQRLQLSQYRLNSLRNVDGQFDRYKLLSELVYNGFNMSVFNSHNYTLPEMKELKSFVTDLQKNGDDFIGYYEDRTTGNIFVYLNNKCTVAEADNGRWINQRWKFERPIHDSVPFPEFDELVELVDIPDVEDFREVYSQLGSCWEDTKLFSYGRINGTTGRTVSRVQAESFLQSLPSNMEDWLTSEGLLYDELTRDVIYDPGFVLNEESDMLTDFLGTLNRQAETAKDDCILINEVFHSHSGVHFDELAQNFSDDELIEYFGENPEYVVCTIVSDPNTATGLQVRQLKLNNSANIEIARNMQNTTILPYSIYYDLANYMNRDVTDNIYKKMLGKYLLVYKAFALVKPGTWMRNYIDATAKAAFDNGQGADNLVSMIQYEGKAARDIGLFGRILGTDPKLLTQANWDIIQRTYKTDMTYEDFELLRGIIDSDRFKTADKYFLSRTEKARQGFNVISGENIGLRNLEEKDIKDAFKRYLAKEPDLPLKEKEFLDIYLGRVMPDENTNELYEDMFRRLSNNLRGATVSNAFDKTIDTMFKPFGTVEQLVRYAQSLQLRDNGFSPNQITRHIHNTQFYNAPSWGIWQKLETIMPFITFKFNNMMYWVRMMDENPRLFRYFEDMYKSVYETSIESALEEGVELDYSSDYALQSGGIPIGNGKRYFNMNSSFLSAMNDFYGIPHDIDSLNPLIRETVRTSMYVLGLNSKQFFSSVDLDMELTDEEVIQNTLKAIPGYSLVKSGLKTFKDIEGLSTESGGPSMETIYSLLNFLGVLGVRSRYGEKNGKFDFEAYQEDLAAQGKWYDANLGRVVDISKKNTYGANDPNNTFEDIQAYMLTHFGKIWDANQHKFVSYSEYIPGGNNLGFDFDNDPDAWKKLCDAMAEQGKYWDYNQRKFVRRSEFIAGGLNAKDLEWETVVALTEEKFPNLKWDANQQAFVEEQYYIAGGLNDIAQLSGTDFLRRWNELKSLRYALYGEEYNSETHKFEKTGDPQLVVLGDFLDRDMRKKYDNYYSLLAIPRLGVIDEFSVNKDGFLVTKDGKYVLTGNKEYDAKVFDMFKNTFTSSGRGYRGGRQYHGFKHYSYKKLPKHRAIRHGRYKKIRRADRFFTRRSFVPRKFYSKRVSKPARLAKPRKIAKPMRAYADKHYAKFAAVPSKRPYKGRPMSHSLYQNYDSTITRGYQYRIAFNKAYQYHNPQPGSKLNYLISPPKIYPYGGGYNKFSFQNRY